MQNKNTLIRNLKYIFMLVFISIVFFLSSCKTMQQSSGGTVPKTSLANAAQDVERAANELHDVSSEVVGHVESIKNRTAEVRGSVSTAKDINQDPQIEKQLEIIDQKNTEIRDAAAEISGQMKITDKISESSSRAFQIVSQSAQEAIKMESRILELESENNKIRGNAIEEIYKYLKWFFGIGIIICLGGAVVGYLVDKKLGMLLGGIGILTLTLALGITYYMEYIALAGTVVLGVGVLVTLGILAWVTLKEKETRKNLAGATEQTVQLVEELKKELPEETKEKFFGSSGICDQMQNATTKRIVKKIKNGSADAVDPYRI